MKKKETKQNDTGDNTRKKFVSGEINDETSILPPPPTPPLPPPRWRLFCGGGRQKKQTVDTWCGDAHQAVRHLPRLQEEEGRGCLTCT